MSAAGSMKGALAALRSTRTRLSRARQWAQFARAADLEAQLLTRLQALADEETVLLALSEKVTARESAWKNTVRRGAAA